METISILTQIDEGMTVFDYHGESIGKVKQVQMTDELQRQPGPETAGTTASKPDRENIFLDDIAKVFAGDLELPEEVYRKLLHDGFIRIDTGMFHADRFATPDQIDSVSAEDVYLKVAADELIEGR
jgi:hypothetical protein